MRKYIFIFMMVFLSLGLFACKKTINEEKFYDSFCEKYDEIESYCVDFELKMEGEEEIIFDGNVCYLKDSFYKVTLVNRENNNKQVIIKNNDGVFVLTPSLNKCFKFPSSWPENSSHSYLLSSLYIDIINSQNKEVKTEGDYFMMNTSVNNKTNAALNNQKILFDKSTLMPKTVYVYDANQNLKISVEFKNYNFDPNLSEEDFDEDANMTGLILELGEGSVNYEDQTFTTFVSVDYNLTVTSQISEDNLECTWYYSGDLNFVLTEKITEVSENYDTYRLYSEPVLLNDGIGAYNDSVLVWYDNGVEYSIYSSTLTISQMVEISNTI